MEGTQGARRTPVLGRSSAAAAAAPSFRLRSPSLNMLRLRRVFDLFDQDGDGEITAPELRRALARLGLDSEPAELEDAVAVYVRPGRAGLQFEDFEALHGDFGEVLLGGVAAGGPAAEEVESDLREAFRVFDEDGDGFISAAELQAVLKKLGLPEGASIDRVRQMICSVDGNHDGRVDFPEFKQMMMMMLMA